MNEQQIKQLKEISEEQYKLIKRVLPYIDKLNQGRLHLDLLRSIERIEKLAQEVKTPNNRVHVDAAIQPPAEANSSLDIIPANVAGSQPRQ